jgi:hypothetical protein
MSCNKLSASIRQETYEKQAVSTIPFLLKTYLEVRDESSYKYWCRWLKQEIPFISRFIQEIESSRTYGG